jgi:hypothetical protein
MFLMFIFTCPADEQKSPEAAPAPVQQESRIPDQA